MSSKVRKKRRKKQDHLVLQLLIVVAIVLVLFEGKLVITMAQHRSSMQTTQINQGSSEKKTDKNSAESKSDTKTDSDKTASINTKARDSSSLEATLAGLSSSVGKKSTAAAAKETESNTLPTVARPDSPAIVRKMKTPVDDSYFSDAAFIGDSRMEGFRMASGITQGQFFTSIGMSLASMKSEAVIQTSSGNITVAAALSGGKYNKIYVMLGTNDLGEYDWDSFHDGFVSVMKRFRELQPDAIIYICSVIYVEEAKVSDTRYINNTNVDKINSILLDICEEEGLYYLDLNEILSNGYGSLIEGASSDGVHMYETYCKKMLTYLKSHYIEVEQPVAADTTAENESEAETENDSDSI